MGINEICKKVLDRFQLDAPVASCERYGCGHVNEAYMVVSEKGRRYILRKISSRVDGLVTRLENKAHLKGHLVQKYGPLGLCLLGAIPLPGTGAWTGALVAAFLDLRMKRAIPSIVAGVLIAAGIMTAVTYGVIHVF